MEININKAQLKMVFGVVILMILFYSLIFFLFWRTVPPRIVEDVSPSSVICEKQTLCSFSCHATSSSPFNYSWTKNGQVPVSNDIKIMNNNIVLTPRDAEDYGVYVCHATNSFGSTAYKITLSEGRKSLTWTGTVKGVLKTHMRHLRDNRSFYQFRSTCREILLCKIHYVSLRCYDNTNGNRTYVCGKSILSL